MSSKLKVLSNRTLVDHIRNAPVVDSEFVDTPIAILDEPERSDVDYALLADTVVQQIRKVFDPELPVNIYDLGLIYSIDLKTDHDDVTVHVRMTLTSPGCPVAGTLPGEVQRKILEAPGIKTATVELVWQPTWGRSRMSEAALLDCGLL